MPKARKRPFRLYEGRCADDHHIRLTEDMLTYPAFLKLSSGAKVLYTYMRLWAGPFSDKVTYAARMTEHFTDKKGKPLKFMSRPAYFRARDELINAGFIFWANKPSSSNAKDEAAVFEFCDTWHSGKPHKTEPP